MIHRLAHRQDHGVAFAAPDLFGGHGAAAAGGIEFAEAGLHHLDGLDVAVCVAHDAVRRGQEDELARLRASAASISSWMAGMSLRSRR